VTQQPTDSHVWLTQEGHDRLKAELDHLKGPARSELAARIGQARDEGDLKENGGYHAAKDEQGKQEARIRQLEQLLVRADVTAPEDDGIVKPGMVVTVAFAPGDEQTFLLATREVAEFDSSVEHDVYSPQSPLGHAIHGKKVEETATYEAPNGKQLTVSIVAAKPLRG